MMVQQAHRLLVPEAAEAAGGCCGGSGTSSCCNRRERKASLTQSVTLMMWYEQPNRYLFFTGKGGVGKTSLACATAISLADEGKRVLLVSTDPASNLGHVFGTDIGEQEPTPIPRVDNLHALNIDPEAAAQAYRDRIVGPVRDTLPEKAVRRMEEELSGACTTEIAAFDEFTALLTDPQVLADYDHIVFDTAPTGHTLRLLKLPSAWSDFLQSNTSGASCLGPCPGWKNSDSSTSRRLRPWPTVHKPPSSWSVARRKPRSPRRRVPAANWRGSGSPSASGRKRLDA